MFLLHHYLLVFSQVGLLHWSPGHSVQPEPVLPDIDFLPET